MITCSIIQKSQLEGAHRLDAEYYQPEYLEVANKLFAVPHKTLGDISESLLSFGAYSLTSFIQWREFGIPFIVAENIKEGFIDYEGARYIDEKVDEILKKSRIHEGEVLLSMSGSVGNAAVAAEIPPKLNSNQDIVKIKLKQGYSPYFLSAFLNSRYGKTQVLRLPVGSVQQHIFLWQTKTLLVPMFPQSVIDEIEKIYIHGLNELKNSQVFYESAENVLLEELGLRDFQVEDNLSFVIHLSDVKSANRLDSNFFQPKYEALVSHFKKLTQPLKEMAFRSTTVIKIDPEIEYKYIEISDINTGNGEITANIVKGRDLPANAKIKLNGGELLISKVRPTRGAVAIVPDGWGKNYVASGAFSIFKTESPKREYLQVVMRSIVGKLQLEKPTTGTSYPTITDEDVENVLIPILPKPTQQKIAALVRQSHQARKKSKELLGEAKRKVEEMIDLASFDKTQDKSSL